MVQRKGNLPVAERCSEERYQEGKDVLAAAGRVRGPTAHPPRPP